MSSPILLILGAGKNIGYAVSKAFAAKGYQVVLTSRSAPTEDVGQSLHISHDLTKPETVPAVFAQVKEKFGAAPSVVVYNAALLPGLANKDDPLPDLDVEKYAASVAINNTSVMIALREAIAGFRSLSDPAAAKSFLYTGNALNLMRGNGWMVLGIGKTATAYAIQTIAESKVYEKDGISIYYVDERKPDGAPMFHEIGAEAAAEEYPRIADIKGQGPWLYTFAKGEGYKDFSQATHTL